MRIALLSDIHANLRALDACLAHAQTLGVRQHAFLGDLVGYGPEPEAVVDRVRDMAERGAVVLRGNHDDAAVAPPPDDHTMTALTARWTHERLGAQRRVWLAARPLTQRTGMALLVHASADAPESWRYVNDAPAASRSLQAALAADGAVRYVMGGHVHDQQLYYRGAGRQMMAFQPTPGVVVPVPVHRHWVATVGSVGQPRDGRPEAAWALLDQAGHRLTFHRVPYDHAAAARAVIDAGLPAALAQRLLDAR